MTNKFYKFEEDIPCGLKHGYLDADTKKTIKRTFLVPENCIQGINYGWDGRDESKPYMVSISSSSFNIPPKFFETLEDAKNYVETKFGDFEVTEL